MKTQINVAVVSFSVSNACTISMCDLVVLYCFVIWQLFIELKHATGDLRHEIISSSLKYHQSKQTYFCPSVISGAHSRSRFISCCYIQSLSFNIFNVNLNLKAKIL